MKAELTSRQSEVLDAIVLYKDRTGFPPTMLELAALIGCASPNAAAEHVKALKKKVTSPLLLALPGASPSSKRNLMKILCRSLKTSYPVETRPEIKLLNG